MTTLSGHLTDALAQRLVDGQLSAAEAPEVELERLRGEDQEARTVLLDALQEHQRAVLLDESEEGQRLRQSSPFCGILTPRERWAIYREHRETR